MLQLFKSDSMKPGRALAASLVFGLIFADIAHADTLDVFGTFQPPDGNSKIEISDCGDGTPCGTVVWMRAAALPKGETPETVRDARGARIMGLKMLHGFARKAQDWRGGTIYDPENGKTYQSRLKRLADGNLEVKGCIGPICQTQIWKPVS
jgi:uncharacterized protein (DUF2147 family)